MKTLRNFRGQLSREKMKTITAGRPPEYYDEDGCYLCTCSGGAKALPANDGPHGAICYCPDESQISC